MHQVKSANLIFEKAKRAFEAGDFAAAVKYARQAEHLVTVESCVPFRSPKSPTYSIILVSYANNADIGQSLQPLARFCGQDAFEIIIVDNGNENIQQLETNVFSDVSVIDVGFNYGCSGGRNLGARFGQGEFIIFLDDDGIIQDGAVEQLIDTIRAYDAVAVRGRVRARSSTGLAGRHYDYGDEVLICPPNAEGISIWRRREFLHHGAFDTLLAGHEGLALWSKMFRFYGPGAFLYAPGAVLLHDYAGTTKETTTKRARQAANLSYLDFAYPDLNALASASRRYRNDFRTRVWLARAHSSENKYTPKANLTECKISILTTAKNARQSLDAYTACWKQQSHSDFEIIFVDEKSDDDTVERIESLWQNDPRLHLLRNTPGRAAALNAAVSRASHDICVIADADDISHPKRLELTLRHFNAEPSRTISAVAAFDEESAFETPQPNAPLSVGLKVRSLLGKPAFLGTLAFRKSQIATAFDTSVASGFDHKWMHENICLGRKDGIVIPLNHVYRGRGKVRDPVTQTDIELINSRHSELLGPLTECQKRLCRLLVGYEAEPDDDAIAELKRYVVQLMVCNAEKSIYRAADMEQLLVLRVNELETDMLRTYKYGWRGEARKLISIRTRLRKLLSSFLRKSR